VNAVFDATLTPNQRHLARRLESFGDVVFGFTISQLALQFALPKVPADLLAHSFSYAIYAITFTAIALLWLGYHQILSATYLPAPIDVAVTFTFLAFTGLVPYAMYAYLHFITSEEGVRYGLAAYLVCAIGTTTTATVLRARNYDRGARYLESDERFRAFRRVAQTTTLIPIFVIDLVIDVTGHPFAAGLFFCVIPFVNAIMRRLIRSAPIPGGAGVTEPTA
jgi:uncharacterized membrane protein